MALYSFHVDILSRSKSQSSVHKAAYNSRSTKAGKSTVTAAAYIARTQFFDERLGLKTKDYAYKGGLIFQGLFVPPNSPEWAQDREKLWNALEKAEKRKDSQLARNFMIALPHELTDQQRQWLITDYVREQFVRKGFVADVCIHGPHDDNKNYHAHVLVSMRRMGPKGFEELKYKSTENWRFQLIGWRRRWAEMGSKALLRAGFPVEADRFSYAHKTLPEQKKEAERRGDFEWAASLDHEAGIHHGYAAREMHKKGKQSDRWDKHERIQTVIRKKREPIEAKAVRIAGAEENQPHTVKQHKPRAV